MKAKSLVDLSSLEQKSNSRCSFLHSHTIIDIQSKVQNRRKYRSYLTRNIYYKGKLLRFNFYVTFPITLLYDAS